MLLPTRRDAVVCNRVCLCAFDFKHTIFSNAFLLAVNQHWISAKQQFKHSCLVACGGNMCQCEAIASWVVYSEFDLVLYSFSMLTCTDWQQMSASVNERVASRCCHFANCHLNAIGHCFGKRFLCIVI